MVCLVRWDDMEMSVLASRRRLDDRHGGAWEFPGGKVEPGETPEVAGGRELKEEVDLVAPPLRPLMQVTYRYPDRTVTLHVLIGEVDGAYEPTPLEALECRWVRAPDLPSLGWLPANGPIIERLIQIAARGSDRHKKLGPDGRLG
ncbi:MAG: (deoxy)nucleoside triphosphate pyrophosphohydrolase [Phycisphaerales bacterium]